MLPTTAPITQEFGDNFIYNGRWAYGPAGHNGMDFGTPSGSIIVAPYPMTVISYGVDTSGFGNLLKARDTLGYTHWFAHLAAPLVSPGQAVPAGQPIALSDNTGFSTSSHLHWGVQLPGYGGYNGYVNPRNWPGFNLTALPYSDAQYNEILNRARQNMRSVVQYQFQVMLLRPARKEDIVGNEDSTPEQVSKAIADSEEYRQAWRNWYPGPYPESEIDKKVAYAAPTAIELLPLYKEKLASSSGAEAVSLKARLEEIKRIATL